MKDFNYTNCPVECPYLTLSGDILMCSLGISSPESESCKKKEVRRKNE